MRALCGRQHGGVRWWAPADAARALVHTVKESGKAAIAQRYGGLHKPKVLVIGPRGGFHFYNQDSVDEAARRALEACGGAAGVPCLIVAVDDNFVVPIPATMKAVGFFRAASAPTIAPGA